MQNFSIKNMDFSNDTYNNNYIDGSKFKNSCTDMSYFDNCSIFNSGDKNYQNANITSLYKYQNNENNPQNDNYNQDFYKIFNGVKELFGNN